MAVHTVDPPDILSIENIADPFPSYRVLRDDFPIFWHENTQSWAVSRYEHVRALLRDNKRICTIQQQEQIGPVLGDAVTLLALDGREHVAQRSRVSPFLHGAGLERFASTVEDRVDALLGELVDREKRAIAAGQRSRAEIDLVGEFTSKYPVEVVAAMMGVAIEDYATVQRWYNAFLNYGSNIGGDPKVYEEGMRAKEEFGAYILPIIAQRRQDPSGEDLITRLCHYEYDGRSMTDEEIRAFLALILLAGGETTDHQLAAMMHTLVRHPDQLAEVQNDRSLVDAALAEAMRYCAIVQFFQRTVREDMEFDGFQFKAGQRLTLMLAAANHDPRRFEEPDEFNIHRTDNRVSSAFTGAADHVGFGGGKHVCLGAQLAKREMEIAFTYLLDRVTDLRLADGYVPRYAPSPFMRSLLNLELTYTPVEDA
jgi:cytochrome P450